MNLSDYKKLASTLFGVCSGCDACDACRALRLVEQVWESGRRSGAAESAERKGRKVPVDGIVFDLDALTAYVVGISGCTGEVAKVWASTEMGAMIEWAMAKGERKVDWAMAAKGWLRRSLKGSGSFPSGDSSKPQSRTSRAAAEHEETFREAMSLNSPTEPPSPCPTSLATGSRKTRRALPSSSPTQPKFL